MWRRASTLVAMGTNFILAMVASWIAILGLVGPVNPDDQIAFMPANVFTFATVLVSLLAWWGLVSLVRGERWGWTAIGMWTAPLAWVAGFELFYIGIGLAAIGSIALAASRVGQRGFTVP